jgi:ribonucleoside-diphosphate reductase alpha chain
MELVVTKRDGSKAPFNVNKIREMINQACDGLKVNSLKLESNLTSKFKNNINIILNDLFKIDLFKIDNYSKDDLNIFSTRLNIILEEMNLMWIPTIKDWRLN